MKDTKVKLKVGSIVYDTWWPFYLGKVTKVIKTGLYVKWFANDCAGNIEQKYDVSHIKFLKRYR